MIKWDTLRSALFIKDSKPTQDRFLNNLMPFGIFTRLKRSSSKAYQFGLDLRRMNGKEIKKNMYTCITQMN